MGRRRCPVKDSHVEKPGKDAMAVRTPRFGVLARGRQAGFRTILSQGAQSPTDEKGLRNPHLLALGYEIENLYPTLRGPEEALAFFQERISSGGGAMGEMEDTRKLSRSRMLDLRQPALQELIRLISSERFVFLSEEQNIRLGTTTR